MFFIGIAAILPANGSAIPLHTTTFIDKHSIGVDSIGDQNSLKADCCVLKLKLYEGDRGP